MRKLQKLWIILFLGILFTAPVLLLTMPKHLYSTSERRKLKTMPAITMEGILDKSCMQSIEEYLLDHFPFREQLRRMKAYYAYDILQQKENNGIYVAGGYAGKLEYPLRDSEIAQAADRMLSLKQQYFPDARTYYAIVPDKNYYQASAYGYPVMDYEKLDNILQKKLTDMSQISLWDTLTIEDYYCTDTHWRQERLRPVVDRIGEQLDFSIDLSSVPKKDITIITHFFVFENFSAKKDEPNSRQPVSSFQRISSEILPHFFVHRTSMYDASVFLFLINIYEK